MDSLSDKRLRACEAQIQDLHQSVSGLEHLFSGFLSGESERLTSLSRILHGAHFESETAVGVPHKDFLVGGLHPLQSEPRPQSVAEDKTQKLFYNLENFKWQTDVWKESITSRMSSLEEQITSLLHAKSSEGEYFAFQLGRKPTPEVITDQSTEYKHGISASHDTGDALDLPSDIPKHDDSRTTNKTIKTSAIMDTMHQAHTEIEQGFYKLQGSVYDCALLAFSKLIYVEDSVFILFGTLASIAIQITMLVLMTELSNVDPDHIVEAGEWWRKEHAHTLENLVVSEDVSLAHAVCMGDWTNAKASQHVTMLTQIETYLKPTVGVPIPQGQSMIMMVLVLWIADILQEMTACFKFTSGLFSVTYGWKGRMHCKLVDFSQDGYRIRLVYLGGVRLFILLFLCFGRFATACWLCWIGCRWLAQTVRLEELLLNAISLAFIVNVDELLFETLASSEVKWMIANIAPLGSPPFLAGRARGKHMIIPAAMFAGGFGVWVYFMRKDVYPYLESMRIAREHYCGGQLDFVTWRNESTGLNHLRMTNAWPRIAEMHPLDVMVDPNTVRETS